VSADNIKVLFTYALAFVVVVGGGLMLYATRLDPPESASQDYGLLVAGFIGIALQYVFNRESATQATRLAQSSFAAAQPTITTSGNPPRTTVTPAEPPA
jgi:hypothetical protein